MKTTTITDFRQNMKKHLNQIRQDQDFLVLTGPKGKNFVLLTLEVFNSMEETAHLLSTPANTIRLMESLAQVKAGNVTIRDLNLDDSVPASPRKRKKKTKTRK
jgi:antitoxin YefM